VRTCPPVASALGMVGAHARHADAAEESWQSYSPSAQARQACLRRSARAPFSVARWMALRKIVEEEAVQTSSALAARPMADGN
jgi:hypothetical protein